MWKTKLRSDHKDRQGRIKNFLFCYHIRIMQPAYTSAFAGLPGLRGLGFGFGGAGPGILEKENAMGRTPPRRNPANASVLGSSQKPDIDPNSVELGAVCKGPDGIQTWKAIRCQKTGQQWRKVATTPKLPVGSTDKANSKTGTFNGNGGRRKYNQTNAASEQVGKSTLDWQFLPLAPKWDAV